LWLAGAALGIAAEWSQYGWSHPSGWLPDLLTGWCLVGCGLGGWSQRPESLSGPLLAAAGFAWFVPNFATLGAGGLDWLSAHALYLHRGPLAAVVLTYPRGRPTGRLEAAAVVALVAAAVVTPVWQHDAIAIALAAAMVAVAAREYVVATSRERRMGKLALQATALLSVSIVVTASIRLAAPGHSVAGATLHAYQAVLCILAIGLLLGLARAPWERAEVTDLVVELGSRRSGRLRDALARALGDPSLEIGYWLAEPGGYVDSDGRELSVPELGSERATTAVQRDGQPLAVLVHDPAVLGDQGLVEAVASAARLAAANVRLRADVQARVSELSDSRRRLIAAGDEERLRLERRLRDGARRRLSQLGATLTEARQAATGTKTRERIGKAEDQLRRTQEELRRLARGIHPRELSERGLEAALAAMVAEFPAPVELSVSTGRLPAATESCAYFVCSEALANVAKYASASRVGISVSEQSASVTVRVEDDGVGGADPDRGTGLRGLVDRLDALGGTLAVLSPRGGGTQLIATIPSHADGTRP
jgi:signal transduction histidine kinase